MGYSSKSHRKFGLNEDIDAFLFHYNEDLYCINVIYEGKLGFAFASLIYAAVGWSSTVQDYMAVRDNVRQGWNASRL
jgi:hypothetical protein